MGAVEPSCEKAIDPLETDTDGDKGPGLEFLLEFWEVDTVDRRFTQDSRLVARLFVESKSSTTSVLLGNACPLSFVKLCGCRDGLPPVILLTILRCGRPS